MTAARLLFALFLSVAAPLSLTPAQAAPAQGTDYSLINPPQAPTTAGKVEVIEFFSYGCPHCFHLNPLLTEWHKTELPANAVLIKVPVSFGRREWGQLVRAYYTLEALGELERLDAKLFEAIHVKHEQLFDLDALAGWAAQNGIDAKKFRGQFTSPEITAKAVRAEQLSRDYKINGVPTLTVAGKYRAIGKDFPDMLRITKELVEQATAN
ncbi:thiol:disulfide interchange protein [Steroidobacter agaridevorans]|uniref:Thiol:disulfide interchange protein n=1 Tax=Steroidobacter agaridevorans TaxID=2695856 RepID=A0A829YDQ1_9GAMM|nr:thiol:disulfide interchange protein DsbA/DsbL [Steroidobacter agaridevorans]GFE81415.1 thiol:disulfide interchange protein [Steroidobacter agaridevorans]GFE88703.1 thiol:disulfide interchange protein [Steroidobacter agaridevorans]